MRIVNSSVYLNKDDEDGKFTPELMMIREWQFDLHKENRVTLGVRINVDGVLFPDMTEVYTHNVISSPEEMETMPYANPTVTMFGQGHSRGQAFHDIHYLVIASNSIYDPSYGTPKFQASQEGLCAYEN